MKKMKVVWIAISIAILFSACMKSNEVEYDNDNSEASDFLSSSERVASLEVVPEKQTGFLFCEISLSEYNAYHDKDTISPEILEVTRYLKRTIDYQKAFVNGEVELWSLDFGEGSKQPIQKTQLITYPALLDGQEVYFGVDRNNGQVYQWTEQTKNSCPPKVDSPIVFATPQSALDYVKDNFWSASNYIVPFELKRMPPDENGEYEYYRSETMKLGEYQTSTCYITIRDCSGGEAYLVHCFEGVVSKEEGHTATSAWIRVYHNGYVVDDLFSDTWIVEEG